MVQSALTAGDVEAVGCQGDFVTCLAYLIMEGTGPTDACPVARTGRRCVPTLKDERWWPFLLTTQHEPREKW